MEKGVFLVPLEAVGGGVWVVLEGGLRCAHGVVLELSSKGGM